MRLPPTRRHPTSRRSLPGATASVLVGASVLLGATACTGAAPVAETTSGAPTSSTASSTAPVPSATAATPTDEPAALGAPDPTAPAPDVQVGAVPTTSDGSYAGVPVGTAVLYAIPDLTTVGALLPSDYALVYDPGQYRLEPIVPGQACSSRPSFNVAGRQWTWLAHQGQGQGSVGVVITGWREGRGPAAFDDVVQDAGTCRFMDEVEPFEVDVPGAEQTWAASRAYGYEESYGAARVDDQVIGVSVSGSTAASRDLLTEVLNAITAEVVGHGSPTGGG